MYCVGNTLDDDRDVYGRSDLLDELYGGRHRRVFLVGMRRTGKTATLLYLERRALERGDFVPLYIAPEGSETLETLRDRFANALSRRRKLLPGLPGGYLKLRKLPLDVLLGAAVECSDAADKPLLVLIDEVDALSVIAEQQPELVGVLRSGLPSDRASRVVVTGSRQALRLRDEDFGSSEPLLADYALRTLPPVLSAREAARLIRLEQRGGEGRVGFSQEQEQWLLQRTGGHPYLTQATCDQAKRLRCGPEQALNAVLASHSARHAFQQDLERTSPNERQVLQALIDGQAVPEARGAFVSSLMEIGLLAGPRQLAVAVMADYLRHVGWDAIPSRISDRRVAPGVAVAPPARRGAPATRYRPIRVLGAGTFGEVVLMEAKSAEGVRRLVAVKLLRPSWASKEAVVARLRDEARILALLRHRAIVRAEDIVRVDDRIGVLMEYVPGVDLRDLVLQRERIGLVPASVVAAIAADVADALDVAYNRVPEGETAAFRVLHRDIKPHNIRLSRDGEVKILDFGVAGAEFEGREHRTQAGGGGTLYYMAPERHLGMHHHPASDIFSLGVVLVELAAGLVPNSPWPTSELAHEACRIPLLDFLDEEGGMDLGPLVADMLEFEPSRRPSAAQVADRAAELAARLEGPGLRARARRVVPDLQPGVNSQSSTDERLSSVLATYDHEQEGAMEMPSMLAEVDTEQLGR